MWILASRGRPQNIQRFINSWKETQASSTVYLRLDECDPCISEYKKIEYPQEFHVVISSRARLGQAMNEMLKNNPNEPWYGLLADDLIPKTLYWDKKLIDAAESRYIAQCNDLSPKPLNCCHPCVGGELVRHVGWFALPDCTHYGVEEPWKKLALSKDLNLLRYLPEVIVEHAHYRFDKSKFDNTYSELKDIKSQDKEKFLKWKESNLSLLIDSIKKFLTN